MPSRRPGFRDKPLLQTASEAVHPHFFSRLSLFSRRCYGRMRAKRRCAPRLAPWRRSRKRPTRNSAGCCARRPLPRPARWRIPLRTTSIIPCKALPTASFWRCTARTQASREQHLQQASNDLRQLSLLVGDLLLLHQPLASARPGKAAAITPFRLHATLRGQRCSRFGHTPVRTHCGQRNGMPQRRPQDRDQAKAPQLRMMGVAVPGQERQRRQQNTEEHEVPQRVWEGRQSLHWPGAPPPC